MRIKNLIFSEDDPNEKKIIDYIMARKVGNSINVQIKLMLLEYINGYTAAAAPTAAYIPTNTEDTQKYTYEDLEEEQEEIKESLVIDMADDEDIDEDLADDF